MLREIAGDLADTCERDLGRILRFIAGNDMFFLNVAMALAKATIAPAHGIAHSTVVTTMARNGTDFGIRVSGTGDRWFTGPAQMARGLLFAGYSEADANPDIGDSCITETVGLGGFAMAASPAVVGFLGAGRLADAIAHTRRMAAMADSARNGGRPVHIAYSTQPKLNKSLRASTASPCACSGDIYCGVPATSPGRVISTSSTARARPKSVIRTRSTPFSSRTFEGLMSRWTTPWT